MIQDLIEILIAYFQYLALAINVAEGAAEQSSTWSSVKTGVNLSVLGEQFFSSFFSFLPSTVDARHYFLVVGVLLPLAIVGFGLLALLPARIVAWYLLMLTGLGLAVIGVVVATTNEVAAAAGVFRKDGVLLIVTGVVLIVFGMFVALVYRMATSRTDEQHRQESDEEQLDGMDETNKAEMVNEHEDLTTLFTRRRVFSAMRVVELALSTLAFILAGLYFVGVLPVVPSRVRDVLAGGAVPLGVLLFLAAAFTATWLLLSFSKRGSDALRRLGALLTKRVMKTVLVAMSLLYMPIAKSTLILFNCTTFSCPDGTRMFDRGSVAVPVDLKYSLDICVPCTAGENQTGVAPASILQSLCTAQREQRLEFSKGVACSEIEAFFIPSAALVIGGFIVVVPVLFFYLIRQTSQMMQLHVPITSNESTAFYQQSLAPNSSASGGLGKELFTLDYDEWRWATQVAKSNHVVKGLYKPVRSKFRYWKLIETSRRFVVVFVSSYVIRASVPNSRIALSVTLCCHTVAGLLIAITKPFIELTEVLVGILLAAVLVLVTVTLLSSSFSTSTSESMFSAVAVLQVVLPVLIFLCAFCFALWKLYLSRKSEDAAVRKRAEELESLVRKEQKKLKQEERERELQVKQEDRIYQMNLLRSSGTSGSQVLRADRRGSHMFHIADDEEESSGFFKAPIDQERLRQQQKKAEVVGAPAALDRGPTSSVERPQGVMLSQMRKRIASVGAIAITPRRVSSEASPTRSDPSGVGRQQRSSSAVVAVMPADASASPSPRRTPAANPIAPRQAAERKSDGRLTFAMSAISAHRDSNTGSSKPSPLVKMTHANKRTSAVRDADVEGLETYNLDDPSVENLDRKASVRAPRESVDDIIRRRVEEHLRRAHDDARAKAVQGQLTAQEAASNTHETEKVLERLLVAEIDTKINSVAHRILTRFLLYMGLMLFIAFGCAFLGVLSMKTVDNKDVFVCGLGGVLPGTSVIPGGEVATSSAFAGYATFANFTRRCACAAFEFSFFTGVATRPGEAPVCSITFPASNGSQVNAVAKIEKWVCENGRIVERVRAARFIVPGGAVEAVDTTGTVRGMCSARFHDPLCVPTDAYGDGSAVRLAPACTLALTPLEAALW
jgi:hypothetical protein